MAFDSVRGLHPRKSGFDLSYSKIFDCDMGQIIPVMCDEVVPGDVFQISADWLIRVNPMVAPILTQVDAQVHYFFVPYRLLWTDWENFITGGRDGDFESEIPHLRGKVDLHSNSDYLGFPVSKGLSTSTSPLKVNAFPILAINFIWNEYYRDENFQAYKKFYIDTHFHDDLTADDKFLSRYGCINSLTVSIGDPTSDPAPEWYTGKHDELLIRNWQKDYFTSATFARQRGPAVALPISGILPVNFGSGNIPRVFMLDSENNRFALNVNETYTPSTGFTQIVQTGVQGRALNPPQSFGGGNVVIDDPGSYLHASVNVSNALTFNISDLRLATQIQKWQERNMRAGIRYTEFLKAHFGVSPSDARLDRPEYIGTCKSPLIVSEVLQTSQTTSGETGSPQGNMAGHGLSVAASRVGSYRADEFGCIVGLFSIMPKPTYDAQGVNRQWLRQTNKDYYFPEFANLSEQAIYDCELRYAGTSSDERVFGYQGAYDEMRTKNDMAVGQFRVQGVETSFSFWTLSRSFASAADVNLNENFIKCTPRKDFLAVPSEPAFFVTFGNGIKAFRPMPEVAEPGLMDHH